MTEKKKSLAGPGRGKIHWSPWWPVVSSYRVRLTGTMIFRQGVLSGSGSVLPDLWNLFRWASESVAPFLSGTGRAGCVSKYRGDSCPVMVLGGSVSGVAGTGKLPPFCCRAMFAGEGDLWIVRKTGEGGLGEKIAHRNRRCRTDGFEYGASSS